MVWLKFGLVTAIAAVVGWAMDVVFGKPVAWGSIPIGFVWGYRTAAWCWGKPE